MARKSTSSIFYLLLAYIAFVQSSFANESFQLTPFNAQYVAYRSGTDVGSAYLKLVNTKDNQYDYNSYLIFNLTWTLTGDKQKVSQTNKNIIALTEQNYNIIGLGEYLKFNYLEFYK